MTELIQTVLIYALPVLFAITVHEAAHGYAARHFGDATAYMLGRVTLNPVKHIDPMGTILVPILIYLSSAGSILFGYAKPVPVNFARLANPKRDMIWVALAGPAANIVQAIIWVALSILLQGIGVTEPFFLGMCHGGKVVNVMMFTFNMLPLLPLDGGRILFGLLPRNLAFTFAETEKWSITFLKVLVVASVISIWVPPLGILTSAVTQTIYSLWIQPVGRLANLFIDTLLLPLALLVK